MLCKMLEKSQQMPLTGAGLELLRVTSVPADTWIEGQHASATNETTSRNDFNKVTTLGLL